MNIISQEQQKAILYGHTLKLSVRKIAVVVRCSKITVRRYFILNNKKGMSISEAMYRHHGGTVNLRLSLLEKSFISGIFPNFLSCGHEVGYCASCRDVFSEKCRGVGY